MIKTYVKNKIGNNTAKFILIMIVVNLFFISHVSPDLLLEQKKEVNMEYNGGALNATLPIHFWRNLLPIQESNVFPMVSLGDKGNFAGLGMAWITWSIQIENKLVPAFAIINKGKMIEFTLLEKFYDTIYWNSVQTRLFIIGTTDAKTDFYEYSADGRTTSFTLDFPSSDHSNFPTSHHEMLITSTKIEISLLLNDSTPFVVKLIGTQPLFTQTDEIQISSFPGIGGLYLLKNQSIEVRTNKLESVVPSNFTVESKLGHFLLNPAVFDLSLQKVWITGNNTLTIDLPNETINIFELGLSSSIVQTQNNSFYEYTPNGWNLITRLDSKFEIQDFSVVDIGLYFGTIVENGLKIFAAGNDEDGDFIPDIMEDYFFSLPGNSDSDGDSIPDGVEISYGTNPNVDDRLFDTDRDGIVDIEEYNNGLDPGYFDSDFGGAGDGWEIRYGFNPHIPLDDQLDNDSDKLINSVESLWNTNPFEKDTDNDKMPDAWEVQNQLDPLDGDNGKLDFDNDGRSNYQEFLLKSDPLIPDPPAIFEGLYYWIIGLMLIFVPTSFYFWKNLIFDENDPNQTISKSVDEDGILD